MSISYDQHILYNTHTWYNGVSAEVIAIGGLSSQMYNWGGPIGIQSLSSVATWYNSPTGYTVSGRMGHVHLAGMWQRQPYITTIGLYNDENELLAVAKISQPIRKPMSFPITFRIRIDLQ